MYVFITDVTRKKYKNEGQIWGKHRIVITAGGTYLVIYSNNIPKIKDDNKGSIRTNSTMAKIKRQIKREKKTTYNYKQANDLQNTKQKIMIEQQEPAQIENKLRYYRRARILCSTKDSLKCCSCQKSYGKSRMTSERKYDYEKGKNA